MGCGSSIVKISRNRASPKANRKLRPTKLTFDKLSGAECRGRLQVRRHTHGFLADLPQGSWSGIRRVGHDCDARARESDAGHHRALTSWALVGSPNMMAAIGCKPSDGQHVDPCRRGVRVETANTTLDGCDGSMATVVRDLNNRWQCETDGEVRCKKAIVDQQLRFRGVQILLVEDNDLNREFALSMLRRAGIIV